MKTLRSSFLDIESKNDNAALRIRLIRIKRLLIILLACIFVHDASGQRRKSRIPGLGTVEDTLVVKIGHLTMEEWLDSGNYNYVAKEIEEGMFPILVTGRPKTDTVLVINPGTVTSTSFYQKAVRKGYFPATFHHLLALRAAYPKLKYSDRYQGKTIPVVPIVALGSEEDDQVVVLDWATDKEIIPMIEMQKKRKKIEAKARKNGQEVEVVEEKLDESTRDLVLAPWAGSWRPYTRFIVINYKPNKVFRTEER